MGSRHDFDFLFGTWHVHHRRQTAPLDPAGATGTWAEFDTSATVAPILDGLGNADDTSGTLPDGARFCGHSLRLYDPARDVWRIWWASTSNPGVLDAPVEGRFADDIGTFAGPFEHNGRTIVARFRWVDISSAHPRWVQDFSFDDGRSWAPVNWVMTHTRHA
ncbi:hypothetical protein M1843_10730 [Isoptericola sp. 4D.3]|uniref:DUF1579 domain-containing protein n=1 Tax=Isoptericola peretonis TaxID=2918523 RepID=A0ABT0J421_9MICO|nr:hypothetical protein [Isoptericola sp. 4D.3]